MRFKEVNGPYPEYDLPWAESIKHIVEMQAQENPERVVFRFRQGKGIAEKRVREFLDDINSFGTWLFHNGIRDRHVCIAAPNSYSWVVVFFSLISSGNVVVPIDRELSDEESSDLIKNADCSYVAAPGKRCAALSKKLPGMEFIELEKLAEFIEEGKSFIGSGEKEYLNYRADVEKLAMIVYTSGTTGGSKGVMITQKNLLADINTGCRHFYTGGESALLVLPFHHLFGLNVSLLMMLNWRCNIFINSGKKYLLADMQEAKAVHTQLVPLHIQTMHKLIMQKARNEGKYEKLRLAMGLGMFLYKLGIDVRRKLTAQVRAAFGSEMEYIIVGGAALEPYYEREFAAFGIKLIPAYGATECSPGISLCRNHHFREGSVGYPIKACEVKIADDEEILIRGDIVMQGYYKDEESTREVLSDGWYHSGDLGFFDKDGFLYITGRKKNLIILSDGENISPETLESKIAMIEGVAEVLIYARGDELVAEIYPEEEKKGDKAYFDSEIGLLNRILTPSHRIKEVLLRDTEFPKNTSQKIKRFEAVRKDV